jgi:ABC-type nitrate/sulfonate/bicarbonate transport system permease component
MTGRAPWRLPFDGRALVVPVGLLVLAETAAPATGYQSTSLPWPSEIVAAGFAATLDGSMLRATAQTLLSAAGGLAIGASLGLVFGALMGIFLIFHRVMEVTVECLRPIPSVALIPIVLLIFGLGYAMEITLIAKTSFWPTLLLTIAAARGVKPRMLEVAKRGDLPGRVLLTLEHMVAMLGSLVGISRIARAYLAPTLEFFRPLPASAMFPVLIAFFGLTENMVLAVIAFGACGRPCWRRSTALRR